jgi:hypothetical protein
VEILHNSRPHSVVAIDVPRSEGAARPAAGEGASVRRLPVKEMVSPRAEGMKMQAPIKSEADDANFI